MNWSKLKDMKCPKCSGILSKNAQGTGYKCDCGFFINGGKFEAIVNKIYQKSGIQLDDPDRNLSEFNNL